MIKNMDILINILTNLSFLLLVNIIFIFIYDAIDNNLKRDIIGLKTLMVEKFKKDKVITVVSQNPKILIIDNTMEDLLALKKESLYEK